LKIDVLSKKKKTLNIDVSENILLIYGLSNIKFVGERPDSTSG